MMTHFFKRLFLYPFLSSILFLSILFTSCSPTKDASFAENDTLSSVVVTPNDTEIIPDVDDPIIDTLYGFYEGEYVAVKQGNEEWFLAQIIAFDGGKTNLRYMDDKTDSKDFVELIKLEDVDIQNNDKVWALFQDGIRFRQGMVKNIEADSVTIKFDESKNDSKVHRLKIFKDKK